jgi:hypothetical protein
MALAPDDPTFLQKLQGLLVPATEEGRQRNTDLGLHLLANSGYSQTPRTFGQTLGVSALQAQQAHQERTNDQLKRAYMEAQIKAMQGKPEGYTLSPGQVRFAAGGTQEASVPAEQKLAGEIQEFLDAKKLGLVPSDADFTTYQQRKRPATNINLGSQGLSAPPSGYARPDPQKPGLMIEPGGPADPKNRPIPQPSEGERSAANYLGRMEAAEQLLGEYRPSMSDHVAAMNMIEGGALRGAAANYFMSSEGQKYYQAAQDWVRAKLRKESGASIPSDEMAKEIKTYFPMPGDSQGTIAQKAKSRQQASIGMKGMAGNAMRRVEQPPAENNADPLGIL